MNSLQVNQYFFSPKRFNRFPRFSTFVKETTLQPLLLDQQYPSQLYSEQPVNARFSQKMESIPEQAEEVNNDHILSETLKVIHSQLVPSIRNTV